MISVLLIGVIFAMVGERYRQFRSEQSTLKALAKEFPNGQVSVWYQSQKEADGGYSQLPTMPQGGMFKWLLGDSLAFERVGKIAISCPPNITMFGGRSSAVGGFERMKRDQIYSTLPALQSFKCLEEIDIAINNLKSLEGLSGVKSLRKITLFECFAIKNVHELEGLTNLSQLEIYGCDSLENLDGVLGLTRLKSVEIHRCNLVSDSIKSMVTETVSGNNK